ncbi:hypothetical protein [Capnocytophaga ochracea]|uniref:hypothetical protein n=1 Tax=Capnocytophaga ochracea TaxID=1018 RepID=UPI002B4798B2|nr:hypothetical protein [Capnocytophaga ochracea]MEB3035994.1 hypothetical protein [Capnocytophaga ochracea]
MTKRRILQFIDYKGIGITKFFKETGIKRGFLDTDKLDSSVSDMFLAKILAVFPELNIEWLLTGEGEMLRKEGIVQQAVNNVSSTITQNQTINVPKDYEELKKENKRLTQENSVLKDKIISLMEEKIKK